MTDRAHSRGLCAQTPITTQVFLISTTDEASVGGSPAIAAGSHLIAAGDDEVAKARAELLLALIAERATPQGK